MMTAPVSDLGLATGLLGCACFACFTWGTIWHFSRVARQSGGAWAVSLLSLAVLILFLARIVLAQFLRAGLANDGTPAVWPLQWALFCASFCLWAWTIRVTRATPPSLAFTGDAPVLLFARGPYRLVRHPFYTSYLVFWAATALPVGSRLADLAGAAAFPVIAGVYLIAARHEEKKFACSPLAQNYRRYAARTGMFLPRFYVGSAGDPAAERFR